MKSILVLVVAGCLVDTAAAQLQWPEAAQRTRSSVYALEGLGALGGAACGATCGLGAAAVATVIHLQGRSISFGWFNPGPERDPGFDYAGWMVAAACAAITSTGAGYGVAKAGAQLGENGSDGWAIGGAFAGAAVGAGIAWLGSAVSQSAAVRIPSYVLGGMAVPVGAVAGYNLNARPEAAPFNTGSRLKSPGVGLTSVKLPDHSVEFGVKVQLTGLVF